MSHTLADYQARADFLDAANATRDKATMMIKDLRVLQHDAGIVKNLAEKAAKDADEEQKKALKALAKQRLLAAQRTFYEFSS